MKVGAFLATVFLAAQTEHITPFTGTWKLNVAKSSFDPGPPPESFTITFTRDGTRHINLIGADGQTRQVSLPWSDGKEVPVTGMENTTASSTILGTRFHDIWKQNGKMIEDVRGVLSPNGRTLTIAVQGKTGQHGFHNHLIFDNNN
ncbi:MAG: hypothetical protein JO217_10695 [Acidobacteriaceae bacterium]|nr:hypothetical protein [Acidobacteriaceae bacterium]MBV9443154.1 hypothetical protein [Acidobacteriaceae bacterium]